MNFLEELKEQQWDDFRYYHQNRINQSLHLLSAICFLITYVLVFVDFTAAVFFGWFAAMVPRQIGHFVFEPHAYDEINQMSDAEKERIKVGYNLNRKVVLLAVWLGSPLLVWLAPGLFGMVEPWANRAELLDQIALVWAAIAFGAMIVRTLQIFFIHGIQSGLVWFVKILTEPFTNLPLYGKAPLYVLKGDLLDPMDYPHESTAGSGKA